MPKLRYRKCLPSGLGEPVEHAFNGEPRCFCGLKANSADPVSEGLHVKTVVDSDTIGRPDHYVQGIECWDYIISQGLNYLEGNVVKYITRYRRKNGLEDLRKAQAYLEKLIAVTEKAGGGSVQQD